jgi:hypothetical protein
MANADCSDGANARACARFDFLGFEQHGPMVRVFNLGMTPICFR